jgi:hypothetical protein
LKRPVIARSEATKQSIFFLVRQDGLLSRSLSSGAHSRDPLARNDVETLFFHQNGSPT